MMTQRQILRTALGGTAFALFLAASGGRILAADVGEAVMVRNDVQGTPPGGAARRMATGDGIGLGLALLTAEASGIKITFDPQGSLTLGPSTRIAIESSIVDQATGRNTSKLSMGLGRLRVVLGRLFGGDLEVETPSAVVGIKGTDVVIVVNPDGGTTLIVKEGQGNLRSKTGGDSIDVPAGQFATVEPGGQPAPAAPLDLPASDLLKDALNGFGMPVAPPAPRPDDQVVGAAFGQKKGPAGTGPNFAVGTASPAAGGAAFTDPQFSAFPFSPLFGGRQQGPPGLSKP